MTVLEGQHHAQMTLQCSADGVAGQRAQQLPAFLLSGVPIVPVTETLAEEAPDYVPWMTEQIDALAAALDGAA